MSFYKHSTQRPELTEAAFQQHFKMLAVQYLLLTKHLHAFGTVAPKDDTRTKEKAQTLRKYNK